MKGVDESDIINSYKQSATRFQLLEESIDFARPLKIAIIGCGYSGICAAYRLSRWVKNAEIVMYDKNPDFGGTWLENKYPGVTCDVFVFHAVALSISQLSIFLYMTNPDWPKFYSEGADILKYLLHCADKLGVRRFAKLKHRIESAIWNEEEGRWELTICQIENESTFADTADLVLTATGFLNNWKLPEIPGISDFKGPVVHTAEWTLEPADDSVWKTRRVAVIGSGSSATQVVPRLQPYVKHLDNYVRGRTWIAQPFALAFLHQYSDWETSNHVYTEEEKRTFREQPEIYKQMFMQLEDYNHSVHAALHVAGRPDIADTLIPDFPFACRRITPGVGYLEALKADNVAYISSPITRITENGIETADIDVATSLLPRPVSTQHISLAFPS
ncbi:hypothetical protein BC629DRAFT_1593175 [Irpex lacteus]|nr:hypothetical protein BC629DRAFT_1593175 [Irpex lacteus]